MKSQDQFWNWLRNRKQTSCTCCLPQHWTEHSVAWTFLESAKSPKIEIYYFYSEKASRFSTLTTLYKRIKNKTIIWSYQIIAVGPDRIWNLDSETKSIRRSLLAPSKSFHVLLYPWYLAFPISERSNRLFRPAGLYDLIRSDPILSIVSDSAQAAQHTSTYSNSRNVSRLCRI